MAVEPVPAATDAAPAPAAPAVPAAPAAAKPTVPAGAGSIPTAAAGQFAPAIEAMTASQKPFQEAISEAQTKWRTATEQLQAGLKEQPKFEQVDPMQTFASLGGLLGLFGSMFSRQPLTSMLNATAEAANALKQGNIEQYAQKLKEWQIHRDGLIQMEKAYATELQNAFTASGQNWQQASGTVNAIISAYGANAAARRADIAQSQHALQLHDRAVAASLKLVEDGTKLSFEHLGKVMGSSGMKNAPPDVVADIWARGSEIRRKAEHDIAGIADPAKAAAIRDQAEKDITALITDVGKSAASNNWAAFSGRGSAAAQRIATSMTTSLESVADIADAISALPTTAGKGVSGFFTSRDGLAAYLKMRGAGSMDSDAQAVVPIVQSGLGRYLANLETTGAATGLVGLTKSLEAGTYISPGDTPIRVATKLADIRRISDAALASIKTSPMFTSEQKAQAAQIGSKLHEVIPYTLRDVVQMIAYKDKGKKGETFEQFNARLQNDIATKRQAPPSVDLGSAANLPHPKNEDEYKALPPGPYVTPDGQITTKLSPQGE